MKEGWEMKKLGDVCKTGAGGTPLKSHNEYYENGTIPWIRSGEVNNRNIVDSELKITQQGLENSSAKLFPAETVVIAMYGATAGQVGILNFKCATNQAVCGILPNENFIPEFLYYFFLKFKDELIAQAVGNAQPNISQAKIRNTLIPIISVEEQKQIVAILDKAFAAIDQAQANIEKNIENAKELFQSKLNDIFSQKGDGWEHRIWKDVLEIRSGRNQKEVLNPNGKYPILGSAGKVMGYADDYICEENTTIVGRKGTINNPMLIEERFWNVDTAFGLHAKEGLDKIYLFYFCRSFNFEEMDRGSGRPSLVKSDLLKISMPIPSIEKQKIIVQEIKELHDNTEDIESHYHQKLNNLDDLKKSILQKAFSGELTQKSIVTSI